MMMIGRRTVVAGLAGAAVARPGLDQWLAAHDLAVAYERYDQPTVARSGRYQRR